jgi:hypothetical protein
VYIKKTLTAALPVLPVRYPEFRGGRLANSAGYEDINPGGTNLGEHHFKPRSMARATRASHRREDATDPCSL